MSKVIGVVDYVNPGTRFKSKNFLSLITDERSNPLIHPEAIFQISIRIALKKEEGNSNYVIERNLFCLNKKIEPISSFKNFTFDHFDLVNKIVRLLASECLSQEWHILRWPIVEMTTDEYTETRKKWLQLTFSPTQS